ncbi:VOC family protein [uncultured Endozoicomonas sp.]|uniref:VOC family protein n=1 Tax=uncultured Endozoicomonas sp. TaxID=432652 RepID=UPI002633681D|nr:VOC family protein [uncultured Endozoicomonas sp.]
MTIVVHHISITSGNIAESEKFYSLFGFHAQTKYTDDNVTILLMALAGSAKIELFQFATPCKISATTNYFPYINKLGITHFALQIPESGTNEETARREMHKMLFYS